MQLSVAYICIRRTKALKRIGAPSPLLEDGGDTVPKMSWYTAEGAAQTSFFFFFFMLLLLKSQPKISFQEEINYLILVSL